MNTTNKKYQVFVSSTYIDLVKERQEIMHALLELDCIPSGMELFPAANDDQWSLIKGVIDECDYYVVIIAGRYGSIGPKGISYTEMEYRYAIDTKKPVIAFLHKDPESIPKKFTERTEEGQKKLTEFRKFTQNKMCKFWTTPEELGSVVSRSLISLQKKYPGVGWVRGNLIPSTESSIEILNLKKEIEKLEKRLNEARTQAPEGSEKFAQGEDVTKIKYGFRHGERYSDYEDYTAYQELTWNEIFYSISPLMIDEISDNELKNSLAGIIRVKAYPELRKDKKFKKKELYNFRIGDEYFQTIKVQLRALGLMKKSNKSRSVKDTKTYWALTPYGDEIMTQLRAIKRLI